MIGAARKTEELAAHVDSVDRELHHWREEADGEEKPLRRHFTQIEAVAGALAELAGEVRRDLGGGAGDWIFESAPGIERRVLDLHRLWGFFRDKLALRYVTGFASALLVADDLAWACYQPAQNFIAVGNRREPPLVYFSGGSTPHLMPRGTPYVVAQLPEGGVSQTRFAELVDGMPIALVGLPWFEVEHVPDLPVIAHEVGHAVENDLQLADDVEALLTGAVADERAEAWRCWRQEVFADFYGVLALGPGFAATLAGLLATHPRDVTTEARAHKKWGNYPTRTLRVLLAAETVRRLGFEAAGGKLEATWRELYETHEYPEFECDIEPAIDALLTGGQPKLDGKPLTAILSFGTGEQNEADLVAGQLRNTKAPTAAERIRPLVAGARLAYDDPGNRYDRLRASELVRRRANKIQTFGRRAAVKAPEAPPDDVRAERNRQAGLRLARLLSEEDPDVQAP